MSKATALLFLFFIFVSSEALGLPEAHEFIVDQTSADKYSEYIVPEAKSFVLSGEWVLEVRSDGIDTFSLEKSESLKTPVQVLDLLRFKAKEGYFQLFFDAKTYEGYAPRYALSGVLARVDPSLVSEKFSNQQFRELLSIHYSREIKNFKWLTFRFSNEESDVVFKSSPALESVRRVSGSNRTDLIFGSVLTLNDFFSLSEKSEELIVKNVSEQQLLVPELRKSQLKIKEDCEVVASKLIAKTDKSEKDLRGIKKKSYILGASWLPPGVIYKPRKLLRVEMSLLDPYAAYHQFVAYVSPESGQVIYKVLLSNSGEPDKFVFTVFDKDSFFPEYTVVKEYANDNATLVRFKEVLHCTEKLGPSVLDLFVPKGL